MNTTAAQNNKGDRFRIARLFRNGRNQAVRLPREFEIKAREVIIRKQGASLILTPRPETWENYFASARHLSEDFPEDINDLPLEAGEEL
ncbi:MAG: type II toxin-antitoxin system VapB family antitoxin [Desulfobacteraceae bacterium]|nr:type II toxin-antitoxin system VapB family antitoxin [Desulfobacteraceae bacterium]